MIKKIVKFITARFKNIQCSRQIIIQYYIFFEINVLTQCFSEINEDLQDALEIVVIHTWNKEK